MDYIVALGPQDDYEPLIRFNTSLVLNLGLGMEIDFSYAFNHIKACCLRALDPTTSFSRISNKARKKYFKVKVSLCSLQHLHKTNYFKVKKSLCSFTTIDHIKLQPKFNLHIPMVQTNLKRPFTQLNYSRLRFIITLSLIN